MPKGTFWIFIAAGLISTIFGPVFVPIYAILLNYSVYAYYYLLAAGIILIVIAGVIHIMKRWRAVKIILGTLGFTWFILFLYLAVPTFSIALI